MPFIVAVVVTHPGLRWSVLVGFEAVSGSNGRQTQQDEDLEKMLDYNHKQRLAIEDELWCY